MEEHHLQIQRTVRYFTEGTPQKEGEMLMALHGYTQHPKFFLKKMSTLANHQRLIVAPEGLHRLYIKGNSGRVGASWMTKEDRLNDIADYCNYLNQLITLPNVGLPSKRTLLGFSQGAATAIRFYCAYPENFSRLILWAGAVPPDLSLPENKEVLNHVGIDLVVGDKDEFIAQSDVHEIKSVLDAAGIVYRFHSFHGTHDLNIPLLTSLLEQ